MRIAFLGALGLFSLATAAAAQAPAAGTLWPNLTDNVERPLRYRPDAGAFVVVNGGEFFNRPLYGGNTAFRVDAGDQPEFALYLPGRGGNLRLGLRTPAGAKWLHEAATIEARYLPGEMTYEIRDPLLGKAGVLRLAAIALPQTDGLSVRVELRNTASAVELIGAFGGASGERGVRDGDIGTEKVPIGQWFQVRPEACLGNQITVAGAQFTLKGAGAVLQGTFPTGAQLAVADAGQWGSSTALLASAGVATTLPVAVGVVPLTPGAAVFIGVQRLDASAPAPELATYQEVSAAPNSAAAAQGAVVTDWALAQTQAEAHFAALRAQVRVETPDPFINAAVGALNVAADAVWDAPQGAIMHGAIAWRTALLGWRGPYLLDALGWPERAQRHFAAWAVRQNTAPIPAQIPPADAASNLARSEAALHSNGDLSKSHYDMNAVYIDALFRHLEWTGDLALARQLWPVIERHLAWERRLFRREFGPEKLPLYEGYADIWASDDLAYGGGGSAQASAYNYWHNRMAARVARLIGVEPGSYEREADLIERGMRELLWSSDHVAEYKDLLGRQLVHPAAALWTFYHTLDSEVLNPEEASAFAAEVLHRRSIPIRGPGVPTDAPYAMLPSSDWLPYTWSINNVVMGENVHTALGLWQAGRPEQAFLLLKSSLLGSMFMGICPGNVGSMNYLDVYRRESQRDFADGSGVLSRALVEGLFGLKPAALEHRMVFQPGLPWAWTQAKLEHPAYRVAYARDGLTQTYTLRSRAPQFSELELRVKGEAALDAIELGETGKRPRRVVATEGEVTRLQIPAKGSVTVRLYWHSPPAEVERSAAAPAADSRSAATSHAATAPAGKLQVVNLAPYFNDRVTAIFQPGKYVSPRSPFASLATPAQGIGYWAGHVNATAEIDDAGLRALAAANGGRVNLPSGVAFATPGPGDAKNVLFTSQWDNYPRELRVPLTGKACRVHLLMAGSTNAMQSRLDNGEVIATYRDGTSARLALRNPDTWWPIEQDYFTDDFQFQIDAPLPMRVDLKTGRVRVLEAAAFKGKGGTIPGGAATVLSLPLDPARELKSLTVRALANEVVIGLMAATLER